MITQKVGAADCRRGRPVAFEKKRPAQRSCGPEKTSRQWPTLPHRHQCSTIGAGGLNYRVRNGNGCGPSARITGKTRYSESESRSDPQREPAQTDVSSLDKNEILDVVNGVVDDVLVAHIHVPG